MADYLSSAFLAAQAEITPDYNSPELREQQNQILLTGLNNQNYLMVNAESIKESEKRAVKGYQWKRMDADNGTTVSHNFTGSQGDSIEVDLNWNIFSEKFSLYQSAGADNVYNTQQMMVNQMLQKMRIIRERMGRSLLTNLHAGRTATSNAVVRNASFNDTKNAFEVALSDKELFFSSVRSVMEQHNYSGPLDFIADPVLALIARNVAAQGSNNGVNQAYQLQGMNVMQHTALGSDVAVDAYTSGGVGIALPQYSFSFIPWLPARYRNGGGSIADYNGIYAVIPDDTGLPINYSFRGYTLRADGSANGGTTDDLVTHVQIAAWVATQVAEISASNESPIYEFALLQS